MKKYLSSIVITFFALFIILWFIPLKRIPEIPKQIKPWGIILGFLFYLLSYAAVSLRWNILFSESLGKTGLLQRLTLIPITAVHQFMANFLPARTGDLTIVYLANKKLNINSSLAMSSLILARAFDVMILGCSALLFICVYHKNRLVFHPGATIFALVFVSVPLAGILLCVFRGRNIGGWLNKIVGARLHSRGWSRGEKIVEFLARTAHLLGTKKSTIFYIKCISSTILILALRIVYLGLFALHTTDSVPPGAAALVGFSTLIVSAIPIQGFLGLGSFEGGWTLGYVLSGLSPERGLLTAIGAHLLIVLFLLFSGITGNLILSRKIPDKKDL
ncbi:flippase-like domain-containing protein [Candidatus Sumerlaeota bacterium]|nr:flippase-like domain-containing protein [Candidatus Sumerlaeota bacterium]